jgi:isoaspartyl peptidase/L-asparaginase-like protein (Ntn-hydrolase superfamily)
MEATDHTFVVGAGAEHLAETAGLDRVDQDYLVTPEGRRSGSYTRSIPRLSPASSGRYIFLRKF